MKLHKTQLASDRTSCRSPLANQVRLVLHTWQAPMRWAGFNWERLSALLSPPAGLPAWANGSVSGAGGR